MDILKRVKGEMVWTDVEDFKLECERNGYTWSEELQKEFLEIMERQGSITLMHAEYKINDGDRLGIMESIRFVD